MLVKVTASGLRFIDAARRLERSLQEFRIRGVKTNIPFLLNLITHPDFLTGNVTTKFLDETPALFQFTKRRDRASKLLSYVGDVIVNGHPEAGKRPAIYPKSDSIAVTRKAAQARMNDAPLPPGTRDKLKELGATQFAQWLRAEKKLWVTDTTMRDAHQSLFATRMRTYDMLAVAPRYARQHADLFSLEMWGGATFDTSMRFLKESPWDRLAKLREAIPNILFQMLIRSANAVGYTNYPDNVVVEFTKESAQAGIDVFRAFDSLNWVPNLKLAIDAVRNNTNAICEAAICYTGDLLDPKRDKYGLKYYVDLAKELEKLGTHILAIKDMAGLLKPLAAKKLVKALRDEVGLPIHFHTHDTAGGQLASYLYASEEGVDVVDCAASSMAGLTSQPSLNALIEATKFSGRETGLDPAAWQETANYWEEVRKYYPAFETGNKSASAEVYLHEMPGGQYANLYQQAHSIGVGERWHEVGRMYAEVNRLFGDIVKVTPSSKVVGDMTLFMLANNLTPDEVENGTRELAFPESVVEFFEGRLGQPPGGFPPKLQARILRGRTPITGRPGESLPPADFDAVGQELAKKLGREPNRREILSAILYPKVAADLVQHQLKYSDTSVLPTDVFFYGMEAGEEYNVEIEEGKTLIVKFATLGDLHDDGQRLAFFELNGQPREVLVEDRKAGAATGVRRVKAEAGNPKQVGAPMPGAVVNVMVSAGDEVAAGQKLLTIEAMKMETTLYAEQGGKLAEVPAKAGTQVEGGRFTGPI